MTFVSDKLEKPEKVVEPRLKFELLGLDSGFASHKVLTKRRDEVNLSNRTVGFQELGAVNQARAPSNTEQHHPSDTFRDLPRLAAVVQHRFQSATDGTCLPTSVAHFRSVSSVGPIESRSFQNSKPSLLKRDRWTKVLTKHPHVHDQNSSLQFHVTRPTPMKSH